MKRVMRRIQNYIAETGGQNQRTIRMHIGLYTFVFGLTIILGFTVVLFLTDNIFPGRNNVSTVIAREANAICADRKSVV